MPAIDVAGLPFPVVCWDTETAGLASPGICQLSFILLDPVNGISEFDQILPLPPGVQLSNQAAKIQGLSQSTSTSSKLDPAESLTTFYNLLEAVKTMRRSVAQ